MMDNDEVGRELTLGELPLRLNKIVVVKPPGPRDVLITAWLANVTEKAVTLYVGNFNMSIVNFVKNGKLYDDQNREVHIHEYLGEP